MCDPLLVPGQRTRRLGWEGGREEREGEEEREKGGEVANRVYM